MGITVLKKISLLFIVIALLFSSYREVGPQVNARKPNILFILADDLGYYDLSCMGSAYYETPHIDRILA